VVQEPRALVINLGKDYLAARNKGGHLAFAIDPKGRIFPAKIGSGLPPAKGEQTSVISPGFQRRVFEGTVCKPIARPFREILLDMAAVTLRSPNCVTSIAFEFGGMSADAHCYPSQGVVLDHLFGLGNKMFLSVQFTY
jgi:hypothetical protein